MQIDDLTVEFGGDRHAFPCITKGFNDILDCDFVTVEGLVARDTSLALARNEGILCGISAGGTLAAAIQVAEKAEKGSVLLAMLPDTGERYLSTILFEEISEKSDDDWLGGL